MSNKVVRVSFAADNQAVFVGTVDEKQFKTGSRGYFTNGKVDIDGKRYQMQVQLVEIGSKQADDTAK